MKIRYYYILSIVLAFSINCVNSQNVVNFTTDEGFTSGALYNQPNWDANFQTSTLHKEYSTIGDPNASQVTPANGVLPMPSTLEATVQEGDKYLNNLPQ